jgi:uncharacterized membrane protein YozB (DUF420 family)
MNSEWSDLGRRAEARFIRVLDILSIMASDLVVIAIGYGVILIASHLSNPDSRFFNVAKNISEGVFLILYVIMVVVDCWEFFKRGIL